MNNTEIVDKIMICANTIMNKYNKSSLFILDWHSEEYFNILRKELKAKDNNELINIVNVGSVLNLLNSYNYYTIILLFAKLNKKLLAKGL